MSSLSLVRVKEAGDTIVEVLISIAVVSSVLGITYSIMNRNIQTTRDNQERTEASKVAQGQVELLRALWESNDVATFNAKTSNGTAAFCISTTTLTTYTVSDPNDLSSGGYGSCIQDFYHYFIIGNSSNGFTITVKWNEISGGDGQLVMAYRVN